MALRCKLLEENMMQNLESMREMRKSTDRIKQLRKEKAEKALEDMNQGSGIDFGSMLKQDRGPPRKIGEGSMKDRCETLEDNLAEGKATLEDHRAFLDGAHAVKREQAERRGEVYDPTGGRTSQAVTETDLRCRQVQENARWMGPALQAAAHSKAVAASAERAGSKELEAATLRGSWVLPAAPNSARSTAGRTTPLQQNAASRPASAGSYARFDSRCSNRPGSAGASMKARFRALEDAAKRNRDQIDTNKKDIAHVVKVRQEKAQKLVNDLLEDMKKAFGNGEAGGGGESQAPPKHYPPR